MKRICSLLIILTVLMSACQTSGLSSSVYVSTSGNDSSAGSFAAPFRTIQKAVSVATPGMKISVLPGTYNENIVISKSGTAADPITLTSDSGTVIINGGSTIALRNNGAISYWIIDKLSFKSTDRYTLRLGWWGESATDHIIIKNNKIDGANFIIGSYHLWEYNNISGIGYTANLGDGGISDGYDSHHNIYRENTIHDFTMETSRGIWTQGLTHDSLIENNTIYNIGGGGGQCIDIDGYQNVEWRHIVRGNTVYDCGYVGIQLENAFDTLVENNTIKDAVNAGIIAISYDLNGCTTGGELGQYGDQPNDGTPAGNCQGNDTNMIIRGNLITSTMWDAGYGGIINWYAGGLIIQNNTIVSSQESYNGGINFQGDYATTKGAVIKDNIITQGNGVAICARDFASFTEDSHNDVYSTGKPYAEGDWCDTKYSLADYQNRTSKGQGSININPLFTSDYHLQTNSPAIGMGAFQTTIPPTVTATKVPTTVTPIPTVTRTIIKTVTRTPTRTSTGIPTKTSTLVPTKTATTVPTVNPTAVIFTCTFTCTSECTFICKVGK